MNGFNQIAASRELNQNPAPGVILASSSSVRATLLKNAGVEFTVEIPAMDEDEIKRAMAADGADAAMMAESLATAKAVRISQRHGDALVIGADQMLDCEGVWYDKPTTIDQARSQLQALRGRGHQLISCVTVVRDGQRMWHHVARATLTMRPFSDEFLDGYLDKAGPDILDSVGAYRLEAMGVQLFSAISGDYFTVLGLPLLPLLDFLRTHRVVAP